MGKLIFWIKRVFQRHRPPLKPFAPDMSGGRSLEISSTANFHVRDNEKQLLKPLDSTE